MSAEPVLGVTPQELRKLTLNEQIAVDAHVAELNEMLWKHFRQDFHGIVFPYKSSDPDNGVSDIPQSSRIRHAIKDRFAGWSSVLITNDHVAFESDDLPSGA